MREIDMQGADMPGNRSMSPPGRPRPRPQPRRATPSGEDAERERQRIAMGAVLSEMMRGGEEQPRERGFFERMGIRRTNETGMEPGTIEQRRNYLGSGAADTNPSMNKKGGMIKAKAPAKKTAMKKGGAVKAPAKKMKSGGKVAPKKMMKGGMTSKPKKMMGGGKAMYAKGGMAKGCK
jgi:hypothetical protein